MHECIFRNIPGHPNWEGSFFERLVEDSIWDRDEFWKLHLALVNAALSVDSEFWISRELAWAVAKLFAGVLAAYGAHGDPNDVFEISGITPDELRDFVERFEHASLAVFSGEVIPESSYGLRNPLIRIGS